MKAIYFGVLKKYSIGENVPLLARIEMNLEPSGGFLFSSTLRELEFYIKELEYDSESCPLIYKMQSIKDNKHLLCQLETDDNLKIGNKVMVDDYEGSITDIVYNIKNNEKHYYTDIIVYVIKEDDFEEKFKEKRLEVLAKCQGIHEKYTKNEKSKKMVTEKDSKTQGFWNRIFKY